MTGANAAAKQHAALAQAGSERKFRVIKRQLNFLKPDGSLCRRYELITDPVEVNKYKKRQESAVRSHLLFLRRTALCFPHAMGCVSFARTHHMSVKLKLIWRNTHGVSTLKMCQNRISHRWCGAPRTKSSTRNSRSNSSTHAASASRVLRSRTLRISAARSRRSRPTWRGTRSGCRVVSRATS